MTTMVTDDTIHCIALENAARSLARILRRAQEDREYESETAYRKDQDELEDDFREALYIFGQEIAKQAARYNAETWGI